MISRPIRLLVAEMSLSNAQTTRPDRSTPQGSADGVDRPRSFLADNIILGFAWFWLTRLPVLAGVWFAVDFIARRHHVNWNNPGFLNAFGAWDGVWYARIVNQGYFFDPTGQSSVAFFPAYPILGWTVKTVTGLSANLSLLIVAHLCLLASFILLAAYTRRRFPDQPRLVEYTLIAFGILPTTLYFRMTYSESLFMLMMLAAMWGMLVRWPGWVVALIIGLTTACRPVGIALLPPLLWDLWDRSERPAGFLARAALLGPVACWGLIGYMAYQHFAFGDALAFVHTQDEFNPRPAGPLLERLPGLLMLEPLWAVYVPGNPANWARNEPVDNPLFSLHFATPIYFGGTALLIIIGAFKGWIDRREWLLAAGLLLIPYISHSHRSLLMSHARYAAVVFPVFIILGRLLMRLPVTIQHVVCGYAILMLAIYSALFVSWYRFY